MRLSSYEGQSSADKGHGVLMRRTRWVAPLAGYFSALVAIYAPCLALRYGYADDYAELSFVSYGAQTLLWNDRTLNGRPLQGLWTTSTFEQASVVNALGVLRLLSIVGLALFAWLLAVMLRQASASRRMSVVLPALVILLPAYQLTAAWADLSFAPSIVTLACLAALSLDRALLQEVEAGPTQRSHWRWFRRIGLLLLALLLLVVALATYQPAAMAYWLVAGIALLIRPVTNARTALARFVAFGGVMSVGLLVDYAMTRWLPAVLFPDLPHPVGRAALVTDIAHHLQWFVSTPLVYAFGQLVVSPNAGVAVGVGVFAFVGMWLAWRRETLSLRLAKLAIALLLIPLSYIPNLVVAIEWMSVRTLLGLAPLVTLYLAIALGGYRDLLAQLVNAQRAERLERAVYATALVAFALLALRNVALYIALPNAAEYAYVRQTLQSASSRPISGVVIIGCPQPAYSGSAYRQDEYASPNCHLIWATPAMVQVAWREVGLPGGTSAPITVAPDDAHSCATLLAAAPADTLCLDLRHTADPPAFIPAWVIQQ
jgi:hypothetical protein